MIVTVATDDYQHYAQRLADSMPDPFEVFIAEVESRDDWELNCLCKPRAAEEAWHALNIIEPMWLMDADIVYKQGDLEPLFSMLDTADMACLHHDLGLKRNAWRRNRKDNLVSAGVVGFAPTAIGRAALAWWAQSCLCGKTNVQLPEQQYLYEATRMCVYIGGTVGQVGLEFNARPESAGDPFDLPDSEIVLAHVPASREMRKK